MNTRVRAGLGACLVLLAFAGCSVKKVDEAHVGVRYTDGPIDGKKFDHVVQPGGSETVFNDHVYELPARQVTYILGSKPDGSKCDECDAPTLRFTAKGGVDMNLDLADRFFLNSRTNALKPFFLEQCQKFDCWTDKGWVKMLDNVFGNPMKAVVKDIGLDFDPESLRYNAGTRDQFARKFATEFRKAQARLVGGSGRYFCGPGYDRKTTNKHAKSYCPELSVEVTGVTFADPEREAVHGKEQLSKAQEQLAGQQLATAKAQQAVNSAQATSQNLALMERQAMLECAKRAGCQLTIVVGANGQVTIPAK